MSVDFAKLNKPGLGSSSFGIKRKNTGVSAQATKNLANSSAASKTSIFSNTRSPNFVAGQNVAKQSSRYSYQGARMRANAFVPRQTGPHHDGYAVHTKAKSSQSGVDKFTENMQKAMILGQTIQTGVNTITGIINAFSSNSAQIDQSLAGLGSSGLTSMMSTAGKIYSASSFTELNSAITEMNGKKASMNASYQNIGTAATSTMNETLTEANTAKGLELAGVKVNNLPQLTNPLNMEKLDEANEQINKDIGNVQNFSNGLNENIGKVNSKKVEVTQSINSKTLELDKLKAQRGQEGAPADLESQIQKLEQEIEELKKQQEQLTQAEQSLKDVQSQCGTLVDDLKAKQGEIKDIKTAEEKIDQKKYDLAKSQKNELNNLTKKLDKLNKNPDKNAAEIGQLKQQIGKIVQSFTAAVNTNQKDNNGIIQNPKGGDSINVKELLNEAKRYMQ